LFYHSNANPPGVAGIARVCREAYPDPYQWDKQSRYFDEKATKEKPRWFMVDVEFVEKLPEFVPLEAIKAAAGMEDMVVVRRGRLSVQPVARAEFGIVRGLGRGGQP
jgi:predicted RNA-binding protein with PUA-like domain